MHVHVQLALLLLTLLVQLPVLQEVSNSSTRGQRKNSSRNLHGLLPPW